MFKGRIANVYGNYLHVEYLDRSSAEKVIREPLEIYNSQLGVSEPVKIQDELVEAVLDQVRAYDSNGEPGPGRAAVSNGSAVRVSTPLLQLVMETVWQRERAEGSDELRSSMLQDLRGVRMIVDAHMGKGPERSGQRRSGRAAGPGAGLACAGLILALQRRQRSTTAAHCCATSGQASA